ncbi:hypothetical protein JKP88DRAFT_244652 [Tribonema minus]|uniref:Potassium channel domain-containing protein n=1 Tax=Tribonema minus TaxID=303371 RepID=A0A835YZG9_9STRA|nr:hypothetical protein JKP88DRAFT_244652 [Tribonema minus]
MAKAGRCASAAQGSGGDCCLFSGGVQSCSSSAWQCSALVMRGRTVTSHGCRGGTPHDGRRRVVLQQAADIADMILSRGDFEQGCSFIVTRAVTIRTLHLYLLYATYIVARRHSGAMPSSSNFKIPRMGLAHVGRKTILKQMMEMNIGIDADQRYSEEEEAAARAAADKTVATLTHVNIQDVEYLSGPYSLNIKENFDGDKGVMNRPNLFMHVGRGVSRYVFDPASRGFQWWSFVVLVVTLIVAFAIPIDLAWPLVAKSSAAYVLANAIFYLVFWLDMLVQFNLAVWMADGSVIATRRRIALHYLLTWFSLDLISSMPWDLILGQKRGNLFRLLKLLRFGSELPLYDSGGILPCRRTRGPPIAFIGAMRKLPVPAVGGLAAACSTAAAPSAPPEAETLLWQNSLTRALAGEHILRQYERHKPVQYDISLSSYSCGALTLAQALAGEHVLRQYERRKPVQYELLQLWRFAVLLPLVLHFMGCGLYIIANIANETYDFREANGIEGDSQFLQWVYGIYWAAMTVSTIGYGDVSLVTYAERGYAIACMIIGATCYAYLVGAVINIMLKMGAKEQERRDGLAAVNYLMANIKLPVHMQVRVRHFLADVHTLRVPQLMDHQDELKKLSPPCVAYIARYLFRGWLPQVWWLRTSDDSFITRLALIVKSDAFAPQEPLFRETILRTMSAYTYGAAAATYVGVWRIDRPALMELLDEFPNMRLQQQQYRPLFYPLFQGERCVQRFQDESRLQSENRKTPNSELQQPRITYAFELMHHSDLDPDADVAAGCTSVVPAATLADGDSAGVSTELQSLAATMRAALQRMEQLQGRIAAAEAVQ